MTSGSIFSPLNGWAWASEESENTDIFQTNTRGLYGSLRVSEWVCWWDAGEGRGREIRRGDR